MSETGPRLLVVDDEPAIRRFLRTALASQGFQVFEAAGGQAGLDGVLAHRPDLVILDWGLPDLDGVEVLRRLREWSAVPVIMLTVREAEADKIAALDAGADDYLTKPFHLPELNARLKAIFRRRKFQGHKEVQFNEISINTDTHDAAVNATPLTLTLKEYELLVFFIANKNRVLTKQIIAEHLWGDHVDLQDSFDFVYQHIKNLRKKITQAGGADYIKTIYGLGYKWSV